MKIGFFTDSYLPDPNGVTTSLLNCARALEARGHTVYIIAPKHPGYKDKKNVIRLSAMKMYENLEMRVALHLPERALLRAIRTDFDIIHGHAGGPVTLIGWEIARLKNIPYVFTYHTMIAEYSHYFFKGKVFTPRVLENISKIFGNMCDDVIAPTLTIKKQLLSYGVRKPISVIHNGIDMQKFENNKRGYLQKRLKIPNKTKILLFVGRLGKEKSVDFLIKSLPFILKQNPHIALVLVGDGPDREMLSQLAITLGVDKQVFFTGFLSPTIMPKVFASADVFVFASQTETQGMAILESMASGIPVVVADHEVFRYAIIHNKTGILTPRNPEAFAEEVVRVLRDTNLYTSIADQARKHVQQFSIKASTDALEHVYTHLTSLKRYKGKKGITHRFKRLNVFKFITEIY